MTTLDNYLAAHGISCSGFAQRLGVTRSSVWRWINVGVVPRFNTLTDIVRLTEGEVRVEDFYNLNAREGPEAME